MDSSFKLTINVDSELTHFGLKMLRERIVSGKTIQDEEEFLLTTYDKYKPEGLKGDEILPGYEEEILVKGKFGFV